MSKKLFKLICLGIGVSLVLVLVGSFAMAAEKELTPYEWEKLSNEDKLKYKTIVIRSYEDGGPWMEKKQWEKPGVSFDQIMDLGDTETPLAMYSKALFQYLHPKIEVKTVAESFWIPFEKLMALLAGGTAPCLYPIVGAQLFIEKELVADITELVKTWPAAPYIRKDWWAAWKPCWKGDRCYGIPSCSGADRVITLRKDWFEEAGLFNEKGEPLPPDNWTWNDFRKIAVKLTNTKKNRWGLCYAPSGVGALSQFANGIAYGFGVFEPYSFCIPDKSGKYTWRFSSTPQLIESLQFLRDLRFKYDCMLTGVEIGMQSAFHKEMLGNRAGMIYFNTGQTLNHEVPAPKKTLGVALFPRKDPYNLRFTALHATVFGFNPTLSKEELKAAFEYRDWQWFGKGFTLVLRNIVDLLPTCAPNTYPADWRFIYMLLRVAPPREEVPGLPPMTEYTPANFLRIVNIEKQAPSFPEPYEYGLRLYMRTVPDEAKPIESALFQALVTDPNTTVEAELNKAADMLNKMVYNYKIDGDTEKMKAYVDALVKFYKENYPEFYKSKDFEEQLSYFKIW